MSYRNHPTFKLVLGLGLSLCGIADIILFVERHPGELIRFFLGIALLGWGASLLWQRFKRQGS